MIHKAGLSAAAVALLVAGLVGAPAPQSEPAPAPIPGQSTAGAPVEPLQRLQLIARMMVNTEGRHRVEVADLEALTRIAEKRNLDDLRRQAIVTRHAEQQDYEARMRAFEQDLGPELYGRLRAALDLGAGDAPPLRPIPPEPPPPPPLPGESPAELEAQREAKHAGRSEEEGGG